MIAGGSTSTITRAGGLLQKPFGLVDGAVTARRHRLPGRLTCLGQAGPGPAARRASGELAYGGAHHVDVPISVGDFRRVELGVAMADQFPVAAVRGARPGRDRAAAGTCPWRQLRVSRVVKRGWLRWGSGPRPAPGQARARYRGGASATRTKGAPMASGPRCSTASAPRPRSLAACAGWRPVRCRRCPRAAHQHHLHAIGALMGDADRVERDIARQIRPLVDRVTAVVFHDLTTVRIHGGARLDENLRARGVNKETGGIARRFVPGGLQTADGTPSIRARLPRRRRRRPCRRACRSAS